MQAMPSIRLGYLPREWIPARSARAFREQIERLGSIPYAIKLFFFVFFKIRFYKRNNEQLIDASLFLFYVDPLLDWNPKSCGDDGSTLNLDDFFFFFREC